MRLFIDGSFQKWKFHRGEILWINISWIGHFIDITVFKVLGHFIDITVLGHFLTKMHCLDQTFHRHDMS